jgi:hypothetical protein
MSAAEYFNELLELALPWENGYLVMLRAFFDASTLPDTGTFTVAGLAFGRENARKADAEWRELMGDTVAHLTDLHGRFGDFADYSDDEAGALLKAQVRIIRRYATFEVAYSCNLNEVAELLPTAADAPHGKEPILDGFRTPYALCCHMCMHTLGMMIENEGATEPKVTYMFENGDEYSAESSRFIDHATKNGLRGIYSFRAHFYAAKGDARLLETADILAWEWGNHVDRLKEGRHIRPSIKALIENSDALSADSYHSGRHFARHLTGNPLRWYLRIARALVKATTNEQISAILASRGKPNDPSSWGELP